MTKIDNLLGVLSTGSSVSFDDRLGQLQNEFQQKGVESVIETLLNKNEEENSTLTEVEMATAVSN